MDLFTRTVFPSLALKSQVELEWCQQQIFLQYIVGFCFVFPPQEMRKQLFSLNYGFGQTQAFIQMNTEKQSCYVLQINVREDKSKDGENSPHNMYKI